MFSFKNSELQKQLPTLPSLSIAFHVSYTQDWSPRNLDIMVQELFEVHFPYHAHYWLHISIYLLFWGIQNPATQGKSPASIDVKNRSFELR